MLRIAIPFLSQFTDNLVILVVLILLSLFLARESKGRIHLKKFARLSAALLFLYLAASVVELDVWVRTESGLGRYPLNKVLGDKGRLLALLAPSTLLLAHWTMRVRRTYRKGAGLVDSVGLALLIFATLGSLLWTSWLMYDVVPKIIDWYARWLTTAWETIVHSHFPYLGRRY